MFQGESIRVSALDNGVAELCFDRQGDAINKFDKRTVNELQQAIAAIGAQSGVRGVLITSAKQSFIVGADIGGFGQLFSKPQQEVMSSNMASNRVFHALEALPVPVVVALNGFALGGGLEAALAADYRVMATDAHVGLPEVKLGLFPGFGGTVRLPRIAGIEVAIRWIVGGEPSKAEAAKKAGVVDFVSTPEALRETALHVLDQAARGEFDWRARRSAKMGPVNVQGLDASAIFDEAKRTLAARIPKHQPAAMSALELLQEAMSADRDAALALEAAAFARIAKTQAAGSLVQVFLNEQQVKKAAKRHASAGRKVQRAAVIGAGIMGGGIAYTSASRGIQVVMKDIAQSQLDLGMNEARKLLHKQVAGGRITQGQADSVLASIVPQLSYQDFNSADVVVEAVVENLKVKHAVLREVEAQIGSDAVIASNTSSLRIDDLAAPLARPENFVGMHFFNPVPMMPLVEVIRGAKTNDAAVGSVVSYALSMGKTPIVVRDGPGFLVNRILTPYMQAFGRLLADGADYLQIDAAMESFGWPMGPAYLNDVVGMDTGVHVAEIICAGFPERLRRSWKDPLQVMVAHGRLGQKNGLGFYRYETSAMGKPVKHIDPDVRVLLREVQASGSKPFGDTEIVERMMLPLIIEAALCLEEGIVASAAELDMALLLGVGLPAYLGGALKYADWLGLDRVVELSDRYAALGPQYLATPTMRAMARERRKYY
ncbi:MAG TPA: fatty acid oxidation complex subunit alpha FadB [Steroidobacter sp.]|uniref:fatty acid oxidation complex subunit alpha FadB n=1 Tax=Steroidobacter sp. TaxID=1978227 RepID=UPI002ED9B815